MPFEYVDVFDKKDLPPLPSGKRYLDFLGGTKNLRCYILPEDFPRCDFLSNYGNELDEILHPIYKNNGISISQDTTYAVPGFYVLGYSKQCPAMDMLSSIQFQRAAYLLRETRKGMRDRLGIQVVRLGLCETKASSASTHIWMPPIYAKYAPGYKGGIADGFNFIEYFSKFTLSENRDRILHCNNVMKQYFKDISLIERDNELSKLLDCMEPQTERLENDGGRTEI